MYLYFRKQSPEENKQRERTFTEEKKENKEGRNSLRNEYLYKRQHVSIQPQVEHILSLISFGRYDIRQTLAAYHILDYKSFKQLNEKQLLNMTRNINGITIKCCIQRVVDRIKYIRFHEAIGDDDLVADPTKWDRDDFFHWRINGKPKSINTFTPEQKRQDEFWRESARRDLSVSTSTIITTATEIAFNKDDISSNLTKRNNSKGEGTEPKDVSSNLNGVADDDDETDNSKSYSSTVPVPVPIPIKTSSTTTTTVICTELVLNKEEITPRIHARICIKQRKYFE